MEPCPALSADTAAQLCNLEEIFRNILAAIGSLAAVVLFIMLVVGGFKWLTSGGDAKKLEQARGTLTAAFLGLILIIAAYIILRIIGYFTGLDLTIFRVVNIGQ